MAGETTTYGLLGARLLAEVAGVDLSLGGRSGRALDADDAGQWLQGEVLARAGRRLGPLALRVGLGAFGLHYIEPFEYDAGGADVRPELAIDARGTTLVLTPRLSLGEWASDSLEGDLRTAGASLEALRSFGTVSTSGRLEVLDVENGVTAGAFIRGTLGAAVTRGRWGLTLELLAQRSPLETEAGGTVSATAALTRGVVVRVEGGRYLRDPVFGAASSLGLSAGVSVRPIRVRTPRPAPVASVGEARAGGRLVRFTLRARDAERVELSGDFTGWEPVPMEAEGDRWTLAVVLEPGLHHFGFVVDGQWAVPPDAPGRVDDGWGRINASVVVEP